MKSQFSLFPQYLVAIFFKHHNLKLFGGQDVMKSVSLTKMWQYVLGLMGFSDRRGRLMVGPHTTAKSTRKYSDSQQDIAKWYSMQYNGPFNPNIQFIFHGDKDYILTNRLG